MVSADNLNLDVLELIFAFLSGNDLPSVASVSRSFLAGVIPRLYQTIWFRVRQAKGYDVVSCCAATTPTSLRLKLNLWEGQNNIAFCHITGPSSSSCLCSKHRYVIVLSSVCTPRIWNVFPFRTTSNSYSEISSTSNLCTRMHRGHSDMQKLETIFLRRSQYIGHFPTVLARKEFGACQDPRKSYDGSSEDAHQF